MSLFSLILLPPPTAWNGLPLLRFYQALLHADSRLLALTLAGIALGLLALRLVDGRPAPLLFRLGAVGTAALALAWVAGLTDPFSPLSAAAASVLLLLLDEAAHLLATTLQATARAATELGQTARRLLPQRTRRGRAIEHVDFGE